MQRNWRQDPDKLTFIICFPLSTSPSFAVGAKRAVTEEDDASTRMLGDINLFLRIDEGEEADAEREAEHEMQAQQNAPEPLIIGEIELMIAEKIHHRRGYGRAALLCFLRYLIEHEKEILEEFVPSTFTTRGQKVKVRERPWRFSCLSVKIGMTNGASLALFESVCFTRVSEQPNFFGELEMRRSDLGLGSVLKGLKTAGIEGYVEVDYGRS